MFAIRKRGCALLAVAGAAFVCSMARGRDDERLYRRPGYTAEAQYIEGAWVKGASQWDTLPAEGGGMHVRYQNEDWRGYYLNYNHRREDPEVFLSATAGPGTVWKINEGTPVKRGGGFGYRYSVRLIPVNGPMRDRYVVLSNGKLLLAKEGLPFPLGGVVDDLNDGK